VKLEVRHNEAASRFEATVEGQTSHVDYDLDGTTMRVHHTSVPAALEGRGIASQLVQAVFAHAKAAGLRIEPSCSYVKAWTKRHPEVADLLAVAPG
jgi:predicted GNAT family acetyltransferase